jgi:hypothetical protein
MELGQWLPVIADRQRGARREVDSHRLDPPPASERRHNVGRRLGVVSGVLQSPAPRQGDAARQLARHHSLAEGKGRLVRKSSI